MEETKVVQMKEGGAKDSNQKLSYEQLVNVANQLSQQNRELYQRLQQVTLENMFKRLEYLFKVVDMSHHFEDTFVEACTNEIVGMITIPKEEVKEAGEKEEVSE